MLREIRIKNFAIIDEVNIQFHNGFSVFTGETGAGKSIIIDAISFLIGGRADLSLIRTDEEYLSVEGVFDIKKQLKDFLGCVGIEIEENELLIKREININGRNRCFINGNLTTVAILKNIGEFLVDIHGQHEHQSLLNSSNHINILDKFGKTDVLCKDVKYIYNEIKSLQKERDAFLINETEKERKIELFTYQISEIENGNLRIDEEEELNQEKIILSNAEKLFSFVSGSYSELYGQDTENGIIPKLEKCINCIKNISDIDNSVLDLANVCEKSKLELEDVLFRLRNYKEKIEFNPKRLDEIESRLDTIGRLKKKYGNTSTRPMAFGINDILKYKEKLKADLSFMTHSEEKIKELDEKIEEMNLRFKDKSEKLSEKRRKTASVLKKNIEEELEDLNMKKISFKVNIENLNEISPSGIDKVEFLISTNPGESLKQLTKIVSGGEMSRIMLVIKTILASTDEIPVLIFDEVDSGIGGRIAEVVGKKLKQLSNFHQVLCITHLAQIACFSNLHFFVEKVIENNKTKVSVKNLDGKSKIEEIAKMLSGDKISTVSIKHAEELLKKSR